MLFVFWTFLFYFDNDVSNIERSVFSIVLPDNILTTDTNCVSLSHAADNKVPVPATDDDGATNDAPTTDDDDASTTEGDDLAELCLSSTVNKKQIRDNCCFYFSL